MKDMFPYIVLIDTIGRVGTITNSADSAYYTVELNRFAVAAFYFSLPGKR